MKKARLKMTYAKPVITNPCKTITMIKRLIKRLLTLSAVAVLIIIILLFHDQHAYSTTAKKFIRNYHRNSFTPVAKIRLAFNPGEILDIINADTLLINSADGKKLYWLELKQHKTIEYHPSNVSENYDRITMACYRNNTLHVVNGNGRTLLKHRRFPLPESEITIDTFGFAIISGRPLAGNSLVLKKIMGDGFNCKLIAYNTLTGYCKEKKIPGLEQLDCLAADNCFAYDGVNAIYFINLYNSRVMKLDTALTRIYEKYTIDKNYQLPLVANDSVTKSQNFISPHRIINYCAAADTQHLFVLSAVAATNDMHSTFVNHNPIDLYNTRTGDYEGSFHLEDVNINTVKGLAISKDTLFIVVGQYLYMYDYKKILHEK